jgi:hypothetical protein
VKSVAERREGDRKREIKRSATGHSIVGSAITQEVNKLEWMCRCRSPALPFYRTNLTYFTNIPLWY